MNATTSAAPKMVRMIVPLFMEASLEKEIDLYLSLAL
jgi:hypothetical protein